MKYIVLVFMLLTILAVNAQSITYQFDEDIKNLQTDDDGTVYIRSSKSLCKYEDETYVKDCIFTDKRLNEALILNKNEIFLAIDNTLIVYFNQEKTAEIVIDEVITALDYYENYVIIGTLGAGVFKYSIENKELSKIEGNDFINDIIVHGDQLYILNDKGIAVYDFDFAIVKSFEMPEDIPIQIEAFQDGKLVVLTDQSKLFFLDKTLSVHDTYSSEDFGIKEISTYKDILFAIDDEELRQWSGTDFKLIEQGQYDHLIQVKNLVFTSHQRSLSQHDLLSEVYDIDKTFSIYADGDKFWLGREGKISLFHNGKVQREIFFPEGFRNIYVSSLVLHQGKIYAATMGRGILIFEARTGEFSGKFQQNNETLSEQNIIQLYQKDDLLWIGYLNALKAFDINSKTLVYDYSEVIDNNYLYRFYINNPEDIFFCTSDSGLIHLEGGTTKTYLEGNSIYSIAKSPSGILFSAENNGVYKLNDSLRKLSDQYFLRSNSVYNLLNVNNTLLAVNDFGVDLLNLDSEQMAYLSYNNLNEANLNAYAIGNSKILLGFENGLIELDKYLLEEAYDVNLRLEEPRLFDKPVEVERKIFDYNQNTWTFSFKTTNYSRNIEQHYKYRLAPLETEWVSTSQENVTFYNLPPGDYTFEVSRGGHRNFKPIQVKEFQFGISKPVWQEWLFWILVFCILGFLIFGFIRFREREIKKKEAVKNIQLEYEYQRLKDQINPHFLFNSFNSIIGIVEESPKQAAEVLEKLSSLFRTILKYEKSEVVSLSKELDFTIQYFEIHQLRFQDLIQLELAEIGNTQNKYVIPFSLQLLVENAIKHNVINSKHKLHISIKEERGYVVVSNNTNKKTENKNSLGLGLKNLFKRHEMKLKTKPEIIENENVFTVKIPYLND